MKRITSIFFLIIFLIQLMGFHWIFFVSEWEHEEAYKEMIHHHPEQFKAISLNLDEVSSVDEHEVTFKGKLYDVITQNGNKLLCVADGIEDDIVQNQIKAGNEDHKPIQNSLIKWLTDLYISTSTPITSLYTRIETYWKPSNIYIYEFPLSPIAPPPQEC